MTNMVIKGTGKFRDAGDTVFQQMCLPARWSQRERVDMPFLTARRLKIAFALSCALLMSELETTIPQSKTIDCSVNQETGEAFLYVAGHDVHINHADSKYKSKTTFLGFEKEEVGVDSRGFETPHIIGYCYFAFNGAIQKADGYDVSIGGTFHDLDKPARRLIIESNRETISYD